MINDVADGNEKNIPKSNSVLLDCTLRDGGFQTNWKFSDDLLGNLIPACAAAHADIVEIGYAPAGEAGPESPLLQAVKVLKSGILPNSPRFAVMVDVKNYIGKTNRLFAETIASLATLPVPISCVRLALTAHADERMIDMTLDFARQIQAANWEVCINLMQIDNLPHDGRRILIDALKSSGPNAVIYLADSFGTMRPGDVERSIEYFRQNLPNPIGFHAHNNLGLATVNAYAAMRAGASWIDGTFDGIGRGAGNAATELLMHFTGHTCDIETVSDFVADHVNPLRKHLRWGPSPIYAACADGGVHPSYGQRLEADTSLDQAERLTIIAELARESATNFDATRLQEKKRKLA